MSFSFLRFISNLITHYLKEKKVKNFGYDKKKKSHLILNILISQITNDVLDDF